MKHLSLDIRAPLGDFSLEIREDIPLSGVTALVGRSASGKSSLLRAIAGLDPCEGLIRFADDVWQDGKHQKVPAHRRRVGFVFQDIRLFEHLDVAGNIRFARRWQNGRGISDAALADIVAILDLEPLMHRQSARLSGGERQRVALARALAARPRIMLLDEPLSGLDPVQKQRLLPRIQRALHSAGCPAVFVSHDRDEVARFADRSLTIARGRVAARQVALPVYKALCKVRGNQASFGDGVLRLGTTVNAGTRYFRLLEDQICLSEFDPGSSSAMLTVPVRVCEIPAGGLALEFSGAPDAALLPCPAALAALSIVTPGKTLWLTAASVALLQSPVEIKGPDPTPDAGPGPGG